MGSVHDGHCFGDEISTSTMVHQPSLATRFGCGIHTAQEENAPYYECHSLYTQRITPDANHEWYRKSKRKVEDINPLTPNGHHSGRTALLTSRRFILNIYSTNIHTEYFKHAA
jgi:hypothetical protein